MPSNRKPGISDASQLNDYIQWPIQARRAAPKSRGAGENAPPGSTPLCLLGPGTVPVAPATRRAGTMIQQSQPDNALTESAFATYGTAVIEAAKALCRVGQPDFDLQLCVVMFALAMGVPIHGVSGELVIPAGAMQLAATDVIVNAIPMSFKGHIAQHRAAWNELERISALQAVPPSIILKREQAASLQLVLGSRNRPHRIRIAKRFMRDGAGGHLVLPPSQLPVGLFIAWAVQHTRLLTGIALAPRWSGRVSDVPTCVDDLMPARGLPAERDNPAHILELRECNDEDKATLAKVLASLTPMQQKVADLIKRGYETDDIATSLGLQRPTVWVHIHGIRKRARAI